MANCYCPREGREDSVSWLSSTSSIMSYCPREGREDSVQDVVYSGLNILNE